jgi:hypothetical protein
MGPAASALGSAQVHLVNAAVGSSPPQVDVTVGGKKSTVGQSKTSVAAGAATFTVAGKSTTETLADGRSYTVVLFPKNVVSVYQDGKAKARVARVRVIHAAPELGSPNIQLGKRTIAEGVKYKEATPYVTVDPGSYKIAATKPGSSSSKPIFEKSVSLAAGTATTATLAGTGGEPEELLVSTDDTVTPNGAPHTGFGGIAHEERRGARWLIAALAALLAGAFGKALHRRRAG